MKTCSKCGEEKPRTEFHKKAHNKDGLRGQCKICISEIAKLDRKNNPERVKATKSKWNKANAEKVKEYGRKWAERNPDKRAKSSSDWAKRNAPAVVDAVVRRRAAKLQRTASWANDQLIAAYYKEAKRLEELTGIQFHVDHIIPLRGELVSGLHVETNLQLLPAHENIGKSNRFDPETFVA
jgi:hypothetical protein